MSDDVSRDSATDDASIPDPARAETEEGAADGSPTVGPLTDPTALTESDDVEHLERTYLHEDADYCEAEVAGRAIVGVTNDAGEVLSLVYEDTNHVVLPNCTVDVDEDWEAVGRRTVEEATGVTADIEAPERVRTIEHVLEGDEEPLGTSHHVVFGASPVAAAGERDEPGVTDDEDWEAGWYDEIPVPIDDSQPVVVVDAIHDVRTFID